MTRSGSRTLSLAASVVLVACASQPRSVSVPPPPEREYPVLAHTGKVVSRISLPASIAPRTTTGTAAVVGGAVVPIFINRGGQELIAAYYIYEVLVSDTPGKSVRVASPENFPDGTCVAVMVVERKPDVDSYPNGEAQLKPSAACK